MTGVILTSAMRANLSSLQATAKLMGTTQLNLATGLKVNSALDNPSSFFAAQGLNQNASDLSALLDGMAQHIQVIKSASNGIDGITALVKQAKAVSQTALSTDTVAGYTAAGTQYATLIAQITSLATDSGYAGTNLLKTGVTMTTQFNADNSNTLATVAVDGSAVIGLGMQATTTNQADNLTAITAIDAALVTLQNASKSFGNDLAIIQGRSDFSTAMVGTLTDGANQLVVADKNLEGANLLSLQTSQQLGIQSLSIASQSNQAVLRLFQ